MNNIFPTGDTPMGMPDFSGGQGNNRLAEQLVSSMMDDRINRRNQEMQIARMHQPQLQNIAQSVQEQPKQVLFREDPNKITPYQQAQLDISKQRLGQTNELGQERLDVTRRGQDISQQRANVYEWKAKNPNSRIITPGDGRVYGVNPITNEKVDLGIDTLSDKEKIDLQGEKAMERVEAVTERGKESAKTRGEQRLGEIAARAAEGRITSGQKTPTVTKTGQQVKAQEIINTRPDLAKYITFTPEGLVKIDPNTPPVEAGMIQDAIYSKEKKTDVNLPSETKKGTTTSKTPTSKTPVVSDPLGIR